MSFQFSGGQRPPHAASDHRRQTETLLANTSSNPRDRSALNNQNRSVLRPLDSSQAPMSTCCIEQACAAFHTAQDSIIALTEDRDDIGAGGLEEHLVGRDAALRQVRAQAARTKAALQAKLRVLSALRDWFAEENPDLLAFAMELAFEATALLDSSPGQTCQCQETQREAFEQPPRGAERWNPFSRLTRSRVNPVNTPFAN